MNALLINFVAYYATQVRAQLTDLPPEVIEDLTDGLEADLMDAMQETQNEQPSTDLTLNDLIDRFGQPANYALELRTAAGFEPQDQTGGTTHTKKKRLSRRVADKAVAKGNQMLAVLTRQSWWPTVRDFLVTLRPVWWVWRGVLVFAAAMVIFGSDQRALLPRTFLTFVFWLALICLSVMLGRRAVAKNHKPFEYGALKVINPVLIILALPLTSAMWASHTVEYIEYTDGNYDEGYVNGFDDGLIKAGVVNPNDVLGLGSDTSFASLVADGKVVTNLFAYDQEGNPIPQVQLLDQDGMPVVVSRGQADIDFDSGQILIRAHNVDAYGRSVGNVFPATSWLVPQEPEYCTPEDAEVWRQIMNQEVNVDEGKLLSYEDEVLAQEVGSAALSLEPLTWGMSLTSTTLSNTDGCIMGMKLPAENFPDTIFPAERIAPLAGAAETESVDEDSGSEKPQGNNQDAAELEADKSGADLKNQDKSATEPDAKK